MFESLFQSREDFPLPPPPNWLQGTLVLLCCLSILLPTGAIRLSSGAVIFSLYFYMLFWTAEQSRDAYLLGVSCTILVYRWLDLVAIHRPERDFWKMERRNDGRKVEVRPPSGRWAKFKWFFHLWNNQRGVGWNIQPDTLPPALPPNYPLSLFLKRTLWDAIRAYIGFDITSNILKHTFTVFLPHPTTHFFTLPLPIQIFLAWTTAFKLYHNLKLLYSISALLTVSLLRIYTPADWPPIFGSFRRDAWSVRHMWGRCWHQMMRRPCSEAGRVVVKEIFRFEKGRFMSRYGQVWVGFAVSAVAHHAGAWVGGFADGGCWQVVYFMVQPGGIMFEDGVMGLGRRMGVRESVWTRRVGFLWVILWFSWWLRVMVAYYPLSWANQLTVPSLTDKVLRNIFNGSTSA